MFGSTSLWTGNRLLVWGGASVSSGLNVGGRYDPVADAWTTTSTGANCPAGRTAHSGVWTGTRMIVWGGGIGSSPNATGGVYCGCATFTTIYRDADGDGYGDPATATQVCTGYMPSGYSANGADCNDASAAAHPGASEVCDGIDNDCDGSADNIAVPASYPALSVARTGAVTAQLAWTYGSADQTGYDVVRGSLLTLASSDGDFSAATSTCLGNDLASPSASDAAVPAAGSGYWYLVRAVNCGGHGTYDAGAASQSGSRDAEIAASSHDCL
jgi:hypothetical protein